MVTGDEALPEWIPEGALEIETTEKCFKSLDIVRDPVSSLVNTLKNGLGVSYGFLQLGEENVGVPEVCIVAPRKPFDEGVNLRVHPTQGVQVANQGESRMPETEPAVNQVLEP